MAGARWLEVQGRDVCDAHEALHQRPGARKLTADGGNNISFRKALLLTFVSGIEEEVQPQSCHGD